MFRQFTQQRLLQNRML